MTDWLIIHRGDKHGVPLVLLPGWGFTGVPLADYSVFAGETMIVPAGFISSDSAESLAVFLVDQQIDAVRILGWSMGGNIGIDFLGQYPERVLSLTLVAVRQSWDAAEVELTRKDLRDGTGVGMDKFYRKCFLGAREEYQQFIRNGLGFIADPGNLDRLESGLDYLAGHRMPESLSLPVHSIQGTKDIVCPATEMVHFSSDTQVSMLAGAGHFPFSHTDFQL